MAKKYIDDIFVMGLAFSSGVTTVANGNAITTTASLCLLWLGFIAVAFGVTRIGNDD